MRKLTIILILSITIFTLLFGYFYFYRNSSNTNSGVVSKITSLFPGSGSRNIIVDTFFPNINSTSTSESTTSRETSITLTSKFQQISNNPIVGANLINLKDSKVKSLPVPTVWYIEKATGYVFSHNPENYEQKQLSNTTWVGGQEAYWGESKDAPSFILRRSKNSSIENYLAKISKISSSTDTIGELVGQNLSPEISAITTSPKKDRYFYLIPTSSGVSGYIANFTGPILPTQVFTSPYDKWQISWPEENTIIFQSAPLSSQNGLVYSFNLKTKSFKRILGEILGLTALSSPDSKKLLYSNNSLLLKVKRLDKDLPDMALAAATLPEKCVWSKDSIKLYCSVPESIPFGNYPDFWYQGLVNFSDSIWEIDALTGENKKIYSPSSASEKNIIDGINLFLNKEETKLFLTNKTDYTLWQLNLVDSFNTNTSSTTNTN